MSMTTMGLNAADITMRLVGPREDEDVPEGMVDLVITDNRQQYQVHVVGTAQTLRGLVLDGLTLDVPADVPLFDAEDAL